MCAPTPDGNFNSYAIAIEKLRGDVDGKSARRTHDCKASIATYLCSSRTAADPKYSWDLDPVVSYDQSTRLHQALTAAGVPNELVTIKGGGPGQFTDAELEDAYQKIDAFLHAHGLRQ